MKTEINGRIKKLTQQAAQWRLISLFLSRPQDGWAGEVQSLSNEMLNTDLRHAAHLAIRSATEEEYLKCFGPSGRISPREVAYIGFEDPGLAMSDLLHFYHSFHYSPQAEDPGDHIAVETGFAGFLLLKEAFAYASERTEDADTTRAALERFQEKHLCRLIHGMANRFIGNEPDYLQQAMKELLQLISHIPWEGVENTAHQIPDTFDCALSGSVCDKF